MIRNKSFINFINAISIATVLLVNLTGKTIPVSALADPQYVAPIYDTEIIQLKEYIESGQLTAPQLPIFYFLLGSLAVAQLGAQDAMLKSPYPVATDIHEWLINMGINLYNSLIGLVPEGNYYTPLGNINFGSVPRDTLKALVAQAMGDAVVARNYPDFQSYLDAHPDHIYIPFNRDLQLGVNAVFGLNGGAYDWQITQRSWSNGNFEWFDSGLTGTALIEYNNKVSLLPLPHYFANTRYSNNLYWYRGIVIHVDDYLKYDLFINTNNHTVSFHNAPNEFYPLQGVYSYTGSSFNKSGFYIDFKTESYNPNNFDSYQDIATYYLNFVPENYTVQPKLISGGELSSTGNMYFANFDFVNRVMVGATWETATEVQNTSDLNYEIDNIEYYQQVTNDYLLDIRGLIGDLVNYVYVRQPVFDNIYTPDGTLVLPDTINVSVDLTPITDLLAPPLPVNLNDIDLYTDNDYLHEIKDRSTKFGETLGEYFVFWHNSDPMTVYVIFGSVIVILIGAFIGKWGHS